MTKRSLIFVLGAISVLAFAACKEDPANSGGGGNGVGGGSGGAGNTPACVESCATAITDGAEVCAGGAGEAEYQALRDCANASCAPDCADLLAGGASDAACGACLTTDCDTDLAACNNN